MVPNIIHFIFGLSPDFGGKPFSFSHYIAIQSAMIENDPSDIIFHYEHEPTGEYWDLIKTKITLNKIEAPSQIHGNPLYHVAHKAGVVRLQSLYKTGGVYLDIDTITVKPLHKFREYNFAIGQELEQPIEYTMLQKIKKLIKHQTFRPFKENVGGLCDAVLFAEPGAKFIEHWLEAYKTFRSKGKDEFWGEHAVTVPLELSRKYPDLVKKISPYYFHYPLYDELGLKLLFEKNIQFKKSYVHHLWESASWEKYLKHLSFKKVCEENTTYNLLARKYI